MTARAWQLAWWVLFPGAAVLAARLVFEQTYLTWRYGPQMVGFALAHGGAIVMPLLMLSAALLHVWVLGSTVTLLWHRANVDRSHLLKLALAVLVTGVLYVPYSMWKSLVIGLGGVRQQDASFLVDAAARGDVNVVRRLLESGAPVDSIDSDGDTALKGAATTGELEAVRVLIELGADPNRPAGILGTPPLMCAAEMGHADVVAHLLRSGANPAATNNKGQTALMMAERNGHGEIAALLRAQQVERR